MVFFFFNKCTKTILCYESIGKGQSFQPEESVCLGMSVSILWSDMGIAWVSKSSGSERPLWRCLTVGTSWMCEQASQQVSRAPSGKHPPLMSQWCVTR